MNIQAIQADITEFPTEAIVNAANTGLLGGGGVDGAIHRKGGARILEECEHIRNRQGGCKVGEAVITSAGNLPATYIIHTVGPVWNDEHNDTSEAERLLASCYISCLQLAISKGITSIAFPSISTGIYRFPKDKAAHIAIASVRNFPELSRLESVTFVCFDDKNYALYHSLLTT